MVGCFLRQDLIFRFTNLYKQQTSALKILHSFTDNVIKERREKLVAQKNEFIDEETATNKTFLDILLQGTIDGKPLSNLDIREEVDTFMFEVRCDDSNKKCWLLNSINFEQGHDTTKSAITFCLYSIARHPEVQQKCLQEIRDVLGDDHSKPVSCNELNNLQYLDLVIKETLRLFPSVPVMGRLLTEELTIGNSTISFRYS